MALDLIRRLRQNFRRAHTATGATNQNGGVISIPLEKVWLIEEYKIRVQVAQSFTGVPTSYDVRRFFSKVELKVDDGKGMKANFHAMYDLGRLTENTPVPIVTLAAASTADFVFDIHAAMDGAIGELSTSLLTGKYSVLTLELTIAPDANNGFIGGTVPQVAGYTVEVQPREMREQTPHNRNDQSENWGVAEYSPLQLENLTGGVNGLADAQIKLSGGCRMRFLLAHAFDAATFGNLTDAVFLNGARVTLKVNGFEHYDNMSVSSIKQDNFSMRNIGSTGMVVFDFGDDPRMWPDLRGVKDPYMSISIPPSANLPAAWRVELCQVSAYKLEELHEAIRA